METKTILTVGGLALAIWGIARLTGRRATNEANNETENLDETETLQAQQFFTLLGVKKIASVYTATPVLVSGTVKKIGYLAENVANWSKVQKAFSKLCGGSYTLPAAISTALTSTDATAVNNLISLALKEYALYATANVNAYKVGGSLSDKKSFASGAYIGRCVSTDSGTNGYYYFINADDGNRYRVQKAYAKSVTLN